MDLKETKTRLVLAIVYALIIFITIQNQLNTTILVILFIIMPIVIYFFVKMTFPRK